MNKNCILVFSFLVLLQSKLFALLPEFELLYPIGTIVTQGDVLKRFKNNGCIGSGGQAVVYEVLDKETNKKYALVISGAVNAYYHEEDADYKNYIKRMLEIQKYNPHQAVIYASFWMKIRSLHSIDANEYDAYEYVVARYDPFPVPEGRFVNELSLDKVNSRKFKSLPEEAQQGMLCSCMILELGEADLSSIQYTKNKIDKKIEDLITKMSRHFIITAGIYETDCKSRNHIYVKSENVFYGNRPMSDYEYWHYLVNNEHFYIPRLPVVIKRIDYGGWHLISGELYSSFDPSRYQMYREKPDVPDDQILDILDYTPE